MTQNAQAPVRVRLLDAAYNLIETSGWGAVTMVKVAEAAGVSRQTAYNEFGTKHGLAEQLAMRELQRFLDVVRERMESRDDLVGSIQAACQGVLEVAEQSVLVRTIFGAGPGSQDADFLKILTTESGEIVDMSVYAVRASVTELYPNTPLSEAELTTAVEVIVRLVLSAMTRPSKTAREAADDIAWMVDLALKGIESGR